MVFLLVGYMQTGLELIGPVDSRQAASDWEDGCDVPCELIESQQGVK